MLSATISEIPSHLHRIWLDETMPPMFQAFGQSWRALHPEWKITDWLRSENLPTLVNRDLFLRAREFFPHDWKRFRADIVRLELLWVYGGVYVDTDVEPFRSLNGLIGNKSCVVGRSPQTNRQGIHSITNAVMAAAPQHEFIATAIELLPESVRRYRGRPLAQAAGPWHLNRIYEAGNWPDVTVLEHDDLYGGTYFVHHWNSGLRKKGRGLG